MVGGGSRASPSLYRETAHPDTRSRVARAECGDHSVRMRVSCGLMKPRQTAHHHNQSCVCVQVQDTPCVCVCARAWAWALLGKGALQPRRGGTRDEGGWARAPCCLGEAAGWVRAAASVGRQRGSTSSGSGAQSDEECSRPLDGAHKAGDTYKAVANLHHSHG